MEAIKAAGGVTFAQDTATSKFASMAEAAAATGCVDFVLSPEGMAAELLRIGELLAPASTVQKERAPADDDASFGTILGILHRSSGIDFSLYRKKMVKRRILRRLALRNINSLASYGQRLTNDAEERTALERDLLISVTSFFRDQESFECLKKVVFPRMLQGRHANETIRIWVAGCATGEEAFSVAITLQECLSQAGAVFPVQIFASDINLSAKVLFMSGYTQDIVLKEGIRRGTAFLQKPFTPFAPAQKVHLKLGQRLRDRPPARRIWLPSALPRVIASLLAQAGSGSSRALRQGNRQWMLPLKFSMARRSAPLDS